MSAITPEIRIAGSRALARARYESDATAAELVLSGYTALMEWIAASRLPKNLARDILGLAGADLEDSLAEESVSWGEDFAFARTHPGDRGIMAPDE